jgi:hypothetical protein
MRFHSFESAKEHQRVYTHKKGFGTRVDWSRGDVARELARVFALCAQKLANLTKEKEEKQNPESVVKKRKKEHTSKDWMHNTCLC